MFADKYIQYIWPVWDKRVTYFDWMEFSVSFLVPQYNRSATLFIKSDENIGVKKTFL